MNVLTIVSVIVLPLALITGFYGMNSPLGYFGLIGVMELIVSIQVLYFRREGLLGRGER